MAFPNRRVLFRKDRCRYRGASAVHTHEDIGQTTLSRQTNVGSGLTTQSRLTAKCNYAQPTLGGKGSLLASG